MIFGVNFTKIGRTRKPRIKMEEALKFRNPINSIRV